MDHVVYVSQEVDQKVDQHVAQQHLYHHIVIMYIPIQKLATHFFHQTLAI